MLPPPPHHWLRPQNRTTWAVGVVAVLLVLAVTVAMSVLGRSDREPAPPSAAPTSSPQTAVDVSAIASAHDDDPVAIITEDVTCTDWDSVLGALTTAQNNGWLQRDPAVPAGEWSTAQRRQHHEVAQAMREAADKSVVLAKETPHRVMRELYEAAIAYWRAYADGIDAYRPAVDHLARAATNAAESVNAICAAIDFGAADARAPLVLPGPPPVPEMSLGDPSAARPFIAGPSAFCAEWVAMVADYANGTREWRERHDPNIPAAYWSLEQRKLGDQTAAVMQRNADKAQLLGLLSGNLTAADFAALSAYYRRAYALAMPTHALPDTHLDNAALRLQALTSQACLAAQR